MSKETIYSKVVEYFNTHPFSTSPYKKKREYYKHISDLFGSSPGTIKSYEDRAKQRNQLVLTKVIIHPTGKETTILTSRNKEKVDTSNMRIASVTNLAYGAQNIKYINDFSISKEEILKAVEKLVKKLNKVDLKPLKKEKLKRKLACRIIITDEHVGLDVTPSESIFKYQYNALAYKKSLNFVLDKVSQAFAQYGLFEEIHIVNLGDAQDGQNKRTKRGGHELKQNLSNEEMFDVSLDCKVDFVSKILMSGFAKKVRCFDVVNDNHSGEFGYYISSAMRRIINQRFSDFFVEVDTLTDFLEHRFYGKHCFISTHGKDKEYMKTGLPLYLNDKVDVFLRDYISHNKIKSDYIHAEKGDLHQIGYSKRKHFDYYSYGSFAPPSAYIQHNHSDCYSTFSIQIVPANDNEISTTHYELDYSG